jgi:uncharacterized protein
MWAALDKPAPSIFLRGDDPVEELPFNHLGYDQYLAEGKLMGSRCQTCGHLLLPPRPLCPNCYSTNMRWEQFTGKGSLIGFTTIYVGLSAMIEEGYNREHPYCLGVVRLSEGPTISGRILDVECARPEDLQVGMPVYAIFIEHENNGSKHVSLAFERQSRRIHE